VPGGRKSRSSGPPARFAPDFTHGNRSRCAIRSSDRAIRRGERARPESRDRRRRRAAERARLRGSDERDAHAFRSRCLRDIGARRALPAHRAVENPAQRVPDDARGLPAMARPAARFSRRPRRRNPARPRVELVKAHGDGIRARPEKCKTETSCDFWTLCPQPQAFHKAARMQFRLRFALFSTLQDRLRTSAGLIHRRSMEVWTREKIARDVRCGSPP